MIAKNTLKLNKDCITFLTHNKLIDNQSYVGHNLYMARINIRIA